MMVGRRTVTATDAPLAKADLDGQESYSGAPQGRWLRLVLSGQARDLFLGDRRPVDHVRPDDRLGLPERHEEPPPAGEERVAGLVDVGRRRIRLGVRVRVDDAEHLEAPALDLAV